MSQINVFAPAAYQCCADVFKAELFERFRNIAAGKYEIHVHFVRQQIRVEPSPFFETLELTQFEAALRQTMRWARENGMLTQQEIV